ncbi:hypothetical protein H4CHR_02702 [Variovorax sp. PBS-H4]|uniref:hypothetical protein n=1 Tax=Variovorax sp. PBS-H4 TaxID=434008 RepID=UPI001318239D|nr:hypothetical protein [Variovorax sp. PBS-H4]VTU30925.1 hypothetical protein H4CHR_02702 [Variovorax sp. PBS-H4]
MTFDFADVLKLVLWVFLGALALALFMAIGLGKTAKARLGGALMVLAFFGAITALAYYKLIAEPRKFADEEARRKGIPTADEYKERHAKAKALFDERCKAAGEKIYRTVENVDGVFVMKPRTEQLNYGQQHKLDDPYGYAGTGEAYLKLFVRGRPTVPARTGELIDPANVVSYRFVEIADETGKGFYRYTTPMPKDESERITRNGGGVVPLVRTSVLTRTARYAITWADISTHEDRDHWIAGSSQQVVDLATNEVIAERIGYMFDRGLGDISGGRSPWSAARSNACPPLNEKTFYFFDRVIQPAREAIK